MGNGKKRKGRWDFGIDGKSHAVKGVWKKDETGNDVFTPSLFGNRAMKQHFGVSARETFNKIKRNKLRSNWVEPKTVSQKKGL